MDLNKPNPTGNPIDPPRRRSRFRAALLFLPVSLGVLSATLWVLSYLCLVAFSRDRYFNGQRVHQAGWAVCSFRGVLSIRREWRDHEPGCRWATAGSDGIGWHYQFESASQVKAHVARFVAAWESPVELDDLHNYFGFVPPQNPVGNILFPYCCPVSLTDLSFPYWIGCVPLALVLLGLLAGYLRRRRLRYPGYCPNCGYDLRASPQCCPECGTPVGECSGQTCAARPDTSV